VHEAAIRIRAHHVDVGASGEIQRKELRAVVFALASPPTQEQ